MYTNCFLHNRWLIQFNDFKYNVFSTTYIAIFRISNLNRFTNTACSYLLVKASLLNHLSRLHDRWHCTTKNGKKEGKGGGQEMILKVTFIFLSRLYPKQNIKMDLNNARIACFVKYFYVQTICESIYIINRKEWINMKCHIILYILNMCQKINSKYVWPENNDL